MATPWTLRPSDEAAMASTSSPLLMQASKTFPPSNRMQRHEGFLPGTYLPADSDNAQRYLFGRHATKNRRELRQSSVWWFPEIISLVFSLACVITIIVVLRIHDGRPSPEWPIGLTPNAILALLASLAKLGFVYPIVSGLGQLRWAWFLDRQRSLADFDILDQASRSGAYGGLRLLVSLKGGPLGVLGGFLLVVSLITSPITQQVITYPNLLVPINGSSEACRMIQTPPNVLNGTSDVLRMKRESIAAAYFNANETVPIIPPTCSTGECIFPKYKSLGVCVKMVNISQHIVISPSNFSSREFPMILPTDLTWNGTVMGVNNVSMVSPNIHSLSIFTTNSTSLSFANSPEAIAALIDGYVLFTNPGASPPNVTFEAIEVLLYVCVKEYSDTVRNGTATTTVKTLPVEILSNNLTAPAFAVQWNKRMTDCFNNVGDISCNDIPSGQLVLGAGRDDESTRNLDDPKEFVMGERQGMFLSMLLWSMFGTYQDPAGQFVGSTDRVGNTRVYRALGDLSFPIGVMLWPEEYPTKSTSEQFLVIQRVFDNLATSLDNLIRGLGPEELGVRGEVLGLVTHVSIQWAWLAFLFAELLLVLVFLVGLVIATARSRIQIIKGSSLATMVALDEHARVQMCGFDDLAGLEEKAAKLQIRMERDPSGLGVSLRTVTLR